MADKKEKQVQIPLSMYSAIVQWAVLDQDDPALKNSIKKYVYEKAEAAARHDMYSLSKTANTPAAKEKARQKYLDMVGIPQDFRW